MCLCDLCTHRFLRAVHGTDVFQTYCRDRAIPVSGFPSIAGWAAALRALPADRRGHVESELAAVHELGGDEGIAHLLEAAGDTAPPPDTVPDGIPLALWFLLHRSDHFWEVFFHHEPQTADPRYVGRAPPGLSVRDPDGRMGSLAAALGSFFRERDGTGRACTAQAYRLPEGVYIAARVAGRNRIEEGVTGHGEGESRCRPLTARVTFAYYPQDGTVLLRAPVRSPDRVAELLACFGRAVLGSPVGYPGAAFALERLRHPFRPLADAADMEGVRLKALHVQYPGRSGRRRVSVETRTSDAPGAVHDLLAAHAGGEALAGSRVVHAVLQVRLRIAGRVKNYLVRLWPDRCDTGPGAIGDRLLACVRRWGL